MRSVISFALFSLLVACGEVDAEPSIGAPVVGGRCDFREAPGVARVIGIDPQPSGSVVVRYRFEPAASLAGAWGDPGEREQQAELPCAECVATLGIEEGVAAPFTPEINWTGGGCAPSMGMEPWDTSRCPCPATAR